MPLVETVRTRARWRWVVPPTVVVTLMLGLLAAGAGAQSTSAPSDDGAQSAPTSKYDGARSKPTSRHAGARSKPGSKRDGGAGSTPTADDNGAQSTPAPNDAGAQSTPAPNDGGAQSTPAPNDGGAPSTPAPNDGALAAPPPTTDEGAGLGLLPIFPVFPQFADRTDTVSPPFAATERPPGPRTPYKLLAESGPRECIADTLGRPIEPLGAGNTCPPNYRQRFTEGYAWGFTTDTDRGDPWFGTWTHSMCNNITAFDSILAGNGATPWQPFANPEVQCEWERAFGNPSRTSDQRPPHIYQYDTSAGRLIERTPDDPNLTNISGIRSAGYLNDVVFMAGTETSAVAGGTGGSPVWIFAFNAKTGRYLGSKKFERYSNPKVFRDFNGVLYAGFLLTDPQPPLPGQPADSKTFGEVDRWRGTADAPFECGPGSSSNCQDGFEPVGLTPNQTAYLAFFEDRLVSSSWSSDPDFTRRLPSGLTISPRVGPGGLTAADLENWKEAWNVAQYYPDQAKWLSALPSRAEELGGWLYVGTTGAPPAPYVNLICPGSVDVHDPAAFTRFFQKADTASHVFRFRNLGQPDQVAQVLYGERQYWSWNCDQKRWELKDNLLHQTPLYGHAGFDNRWQYYGGWGGIKFRGRIYFGGLDLSGFARYVGLNPDIGLVQNSYGWDLPAAVWTESADAMAPNTPELGADAWYFDDPNTPAKPVTTTGFGDAFNWGARDWYSDGDKRLFVTSQGGWDGLPATPGPPRHPGWELYELFPPHKPGDHGGKPGTKPGKHRVFVKHRSGRSHRASERSHHKRGRAHRKRSS